MITPFVSIHLSLNSTVEEQRKAREIFALVRQLSSEKDTRDTSDDIPAVVVTPAPPPPAPSIGDAAAAFGVGATVPPPPAAIVPPAPPAAVELDVQGLPWDARIHAITKAKIQNGSWKVKRGVEDAATAAVIAELRALYPAPAGSAAVAASSTPAAGTPPPPPSTPPTVGVDLSQPSDGTFIGIMKKVGAAQKAGKLTSAQVVASCTACGVAGIHILAKQPELIPAVEAMIDADIAAAG